MERVLRGKEIFEIIPFDYHNNVLCYPIRHHSPACSFHLHTIIQKYQPDCILVEGPETANDLIPVLVGEKTELPVAFYYFYKDRKGLISEEKEDYKCYYPFLYCSPEYQALKTACELGIDHAFIDLPYGEILIHTAKETGLRTKDRKNNYNDDSYLVQSTYYKAICEQAQVRNFEEFWEKYYEINGLTLSAEQFTANLLTYCYYTRKDLTQESLMEDGCIVREQYMLQKIQAAKEKYHRILVVTGGFHTVSLAASALNNEKQENTISIHNFSQNDQNVYPMAYSLEAADALNGYASGMQNPGFYESVYEKLMEENRTNASSVYSEVVLDLLLKTAKDTKKKNLLLTMSDIGSAMNLCTGLAQLRNKQEPGLYELYDSVTSAFIKGELTVSTGIPLDLLRKNAMGSRVGKVADLGRLVPILADYEVQCKAFGLQEKSILSKDLELSIYAKKKHREISYFFHQMDFLETNFAQLKKGPRMMDQQDKNRMKEQWSYHWSSHMVAALIDHSVEGATIREACLRIASKRLKANTNVRETTRIYVQCFLMGIPIREITLQGLDEILKDDSDFFSLGDGLSYLQMLSRLQLLFDYDTDETVTYKRELLYKVISLLPSMVNIEPEKAGEVIRFCSMFAGMVKESEFIAEQPLLYEAFEFMNRMPKKEPTVHGAILGLLYGEDTSYETEIEQVVLSFFRGSFEAIQQGTGFLRGLFYTARDLVFLKSSFIEALDALLEKLDPDQFLEILPSLRLAFRIYNPSETDMIAAKVARLCQTDKSILKKKLVIDYEVYAMGSQLDLEIQQELQRRER